MHHRAILNLPHNDSIFRRERDAFIARFRFMLYLTVSNETSEIEIVSYS